MLHKHNFFYYTSIRFILIVCISIICSCSKAPNGNHKLSTSKDTTLLNVAYGAHPRQVYDLYLPAKRDSSTPIILMIHGGAWKAGQKADFIYYQNLIKSKWKNVAIVNMNYRLANNAENIHHKEIMDDINSVVNEIIANKSKYQISNNIGVLGASAGGQLAMIYAYKYNSSIKCVGNIFGPSIINDWSWYNSNNVWLGGYTGDILSEYVGQKWDTTAYKSVSPYWNISKSSQPTIIFHGNLDPIVPVYQSQWMHSKLKSLGVINQYHEYIAFHSFDNTQSDDVMNKLVSFFQIYLK